MGKHTQIVTIQQIADASPGDDIQQTIRNCCLDYVQTRGTRWVILGGDSEPGNGGLVPDRDTRHRTGRQPYSDIPTDIYYISEKDWDANKGGAYESAYPEKKFAPNMIYTCPESGAYPKLRTSRQIVESGWQAGRVEQFFATRSPWDKETDGDHDLTPGNWLEMVNAGRAAKLHMHGHGFLPVWILENHPKLNIDQVAKLTNKNACLALTTVSCFTRHYAAESDPSIAESILRARDSGAVLVVAPSREGVPVFRNPREDVRLMITEGKMDAATETMTLFWKYALTRDLTAGEALRAAKAELADDAMKTSGYHFAACVFGRAESPREASASKAGLRPGVTHIPYSALNLDYTVLTP